MNKSGNDVDQFLQELNQEENGQRLSDVSHPDHDDGQWNKVSDFSWFRDLNGHRLEYRPHQRKWQYRGKTKSGDVLKFIKQNTKTPNAKYKF